MSAYHDPKDHNLDLKVKRSNAMINASYQSTLFAKKVTALAIASMSVQDDSLVADLSVSDLRNQLGLKGNSVYNQIKGVSVETLGQKLLFEDDEKKSFDLYNVFSHAKYDEDKNLTINLQKHIFNSVSEFSEKKSTTGKIQTILKGYGRIVSGFQTSSGLIITFYLIKTIIIYMAIEGPLFWLKKRGALFSYKLP